MPNMTQLQQIGIGGAGLGVLGSAVTGYGQYQQGQQERAAYDYNADVTLEKMRQDMQTTESRYSELIGRQTSAYAKAGVDIASGSPLLVMAHTAAQNAKEQESEYQAGTQEANLERYYGKVAAWKGTTSGIGSFLSGLSGGLLSAAKVMS